MESELCIADLANAVQTRPGILYAVCVSVTDTMHVTAQPFSSNSHLGLVTTHLPLRHEWLSSSSDPLFLFREPRAVDPDWAPRCSGTAIILTITHVFSLIIHITANM